MHAELLTFLNLCGSSVACSPPSSQQSPLWVGNQTPHCLSSLSCEIWGMGSGCTALNCSEFHFTSLRFLRNALNREVCRIVEQHRALMMPVLRMNYNESHFWQSAGLTKPLNYSIVHWNNFNIHSNFPCAVLAKPPNHLLLILIQKRGLKKLLQILVKKIVIKREISLLQKNEEQHYFLEHLR